MQRTLAELGFEPHQRGCELVLGNCIFAELAEAHRELICALNAALVSGLIAGAEVTGLEATSGSIEGGLCCARLVSA